MLIVARRHDGYTGREDLDWADPMTVFFFFGSVVLVSIIVSVFMAQVMTNAPFFDAIGPFSAGLLGLLGCFLTAYAFFLILDPDPVSELDVPVPLLVRTLPITGFSAFVWLPIYVTLFNRLRRKRQTA